MSICMTILTRKCNKILIQNLCAKFNAFSRRNDYIFFLKNEALRNESVKIIFATRKFLEFSFFEKIIYYMLH